MQIWDQIFRAQQYVILRRSHGQITNFQDRPRTLLQSILKLAGTGHRGPGLASTFGNRSLRHEQNFKCRVPISYEYIDTTIRKEERGRADTMAMLPPPPTKPITLPKQRGFTRGEKNKKKNSGQGDKKGEEYAKSRTRRERLSYWKIGFMTMAATQEHLSGMLLVLLKKKNSSAYGTVYYLNRENLVPNCPIS